MSYMRNGLGDYDRVSNWGWMYYPKPYVFADPEKLTPPANFYAPSESMGLGCAGGCGCAGRCQAGVGGLDVSQWGPGEWILTAAVVGTLAHIISTKGAVLKGKPWGWK